MIWLLQGIVITPHPSHYPTTDFGTTSGTATYQSDTPGHFMTSPRNSSIKHYLSTRQFTVFGSPVFVLDESSTEEKLIFVRMCYTQKVCRPVKLHPTMGFPKKAYKTLELLSFDQTDRDCGECQLL